MTIQRTERFMAMKGQGYYSKATTGARDVILGAAPLVLGAIERMNLGAASGAVRITDMGCADGGTSLDLWRQVLPKIRAIAPKRPIEIVYTDLPRNDFSQLFRTVHNQTDRQSYVGEVDNVFPLASATSFHDAILPPETLDLGFSSTASHYIARVPCNISTHVHMVGAKGEERDAFVRQGAADWRSFLLNRARELKRGGRLCLFNFGIDEEGRYLGHTGGVSMFDTYDSLWRAMRDSGRITADEYLRTNFPQHYRTRAEFVAPLEDPNDPVHAAGLRLEHVESRVVRCPYARDFESHGDAAKFAKEYIPTLRSWSEPVFASALDPARPLEERAQIVDDFYQAYEDAVAQSPHGHGMDYVHIYLVIRKD
ncbi:MAG: SAM-dependent methyltransferase [Hyphomicrobiales bacterium]